MKFSVGANSFAKNGSGDTSASSERLSRMNSLLQVCVAAA
jgi:hypothetical protein